MSDRGALRIALGVALVGFGCGHAEQKVVDQYFNALNAKDTQTLSSFAAVSLDTKDKRVDRWSITQASEPKREAAPLMALVKKMRDVEEEVAAQTKTWNAYKLEHYPELEKVRDLLKANGKIPANLSAVAAEYEKFNQKDRELKKASAEAKDAFTKESRSVALSVGTHEGLEEMTGELVTEELSLALTIGGEAQNYLMALRKYEMTSKSQVGRATSRWIVHSLTAK